MNLNRLKRGFTKTNPERGLHQLPGSKKSTAHGINSHSIRVKGQYIPGNTDRIGRAFGLMGYALAWLYFILLPCSMLTKNSTVFYPLPLFVIGFALVHGCAMFDDGLRQSKTPWASRGIKTFWISTLFFGLIGIIASMLGS
jgi:uncharacterized membrane protein YecN with MAPEG domain